MKEMNLFERFLYEAPGEDPPPDIGGDEPEQDSGPPDMGSDTQEEVDSGPPDMSFDDSGFDDGGGAPPELGDDMGGEEGFDDEFGDDEQIEDPNSQMELDEKISAIMNQQLYQRFLSMVNKVSTEISSIKDNGDVLYSLSPESIDIVAALEKLDENLHLYLKHNFINADYSKNLLFFNECLNLLKLLNITFDKNIHKGIKQSE